MNGFAVFWGLDWHICGTCFSVFQYLVSALDRLTDFGSVLTLSVFVFYRIPAHYVYPQAFVQPSVVIPHVQPSAATATAAAATSPYLDYTGAAYAQYSAAAATAAAAAAYEQYPYAASPAPTSYMTTAGYGYTVQQPLATAATPGAAAAAAAFSQYQPQQLQTDRMQ